MRHATRRRGVDGWERLPRARGGWAPPTPLRHLLGFMLPSHTATWPSRVFMDFSGNQPALGSSPRRGLRPGDSLLGQSFLPRSGPLRAPACRRVCLAAGPPAPAPTAPSERALTGSAALPPPLVAGGPPALIAAGRRAALSAAAAAAAATSPKLAAVHPLRPPPVPGGSCGSGSGCPHEEQKRSSRDVGIRSQLWHWNWANQATTDAEGPTVEGGADRETPEAAMVRRCLS